MPDVPHEWPPSPPQRVRPLGHAQACRRCGLRRTWSPSGLRWLYASPPVLTDCVLKSPPMGGCRGAPPPSGPAPA